MQRLSLCHAPRAACRGAVLLAALWVCTTFAPAHAEAATASTADELLVVNCLLPGQIRQLGRRTTYMSPRRPVRTTALECRVKGGEYVLKDQVSLQNALSVWLAAAQEGSAEAQTTLGEAFEQGLGVPPDYVAARHWYQQAAEQGFSRALTNLGNLYERGLGVVADAQTALGFYRRAAGLPAALDNTMSLDRVADVTPVDDKLRAELASLQQVLTQMQQDARAHQQVLTRADVAEQQVAAQAGRLAGYEQALQARDATIAQLQNTLDQLRRQEVDSAMLAEQIDVLSQAMTDQTAVLAAAEREASTSTQQAAALQAQLAEREGQLQHTQAQASAQLSQIQRLMAELEQSRAQTETLPVDKQALLAGPSLTMVEPQLSSTRGLVKVSLPKAARTASTIVGRVAAPAGLLTLTVNGEAATPNSAGVFTYALQDQRSVQIMAIDNQGKRADLNFEFAEKPSPAPARPKLKLGTYRALLIANSNYRYLPKLTTPNSDINRLQRILEEQYGFEVTVLRDATRYEMLSALNKLRASLTSDDNLLVYYAGHGELDRANMRGHWLPVDAEPGSTANWVSNVSITDILNIIQARQIMLVVDSCYSGTLTRSSLSQIDPAMTDAERATWLALMAQKKSRVVLTSGGLAPVMDAGGGNHSVFASAFLDVLAGNGDLMSGRSLYEAIAARVAHAASRYEFEQIPAYAPIARSGHEAGDFMWLPVVR